MYWMVGLMSISLVAVVGLGVWLELYPLKRRKPAPRWLRGTVGVNLLTFVAAEVGLLFLATDTALAQPAAQGASGGEVSVGLGLALIGIGIPTALATIGAGIAVGPVGAAAMAVLAEKPEIFGRTLIYLGLAEGIAIYGLVVSILMLGKIP